MVLVRNAYGTILSTEKRSGYTFRYRILNVTSLFTQIKYDFTNVYLNKSSFSAQQDRILLYIN